MCLGSSVQAPWEYESLDTACIMYALQLVGTHLETTIWAFKVLLPLKFTVDSSCVVVKTSSILINDLVLKMFNITMIYARTLFQICAAYRLRLWTAFYPETN